MAAKFEEHQLSISSGDSDVDDLSDQQIHRLLRDAESRLRAKPLHAGRPPGEHLMPLPKFSQINPGAIPQPYVTSADEVAHVDSPRLLTPQDKGLADSPRFVEDPIRVKERSMKVKKATAGPNWFNLPRTNLTPQLKRDLQLLRLRSVLDPKRHYKKNTSKGGQFPEFSQVGTIVEGSTEFFSARIPNKQRKKTFVDEVLAGEKESGYFGRKYNEVQASKTSGKKAFYKKLQERRSSVGKKR
ncbi:MAG: hypothetical protein M1839_001218 [Geoglossum umbratile]|nr:MAG: hypothetical protein M1839_001218 [Geoglossum umbratile]